MDDETVGLGMIGSASGRVRAENVDARSKGESMGSLASCPLTPMPRCSYQTLTCLFL